MTVDLPEPAVLAPPEMPLATVVLSADGVEIGRFYRENRRWIGFDEMSTHVIDALVAAEDHRFFRHDGVDAVRLGGAVWRTVRGEVQGGSTITMQLARNLYPEIGSAVSLTRKIREIAMAHRIEDRFSKAKILEAYLNFVPFGYSTFGIEAAARLYFGRSAAELTVPQAATLVGSLKATTVYNPVRHPEASLRRRNVVIGRMRDVGYLPPHEAESMMKEPLGIAFQEQILTGGSAPYFLAHVRRQLDSWGDVHGYDIYRDGLQVHTTIDSRLQAVAEDAVRRQTEALQRVASLEWGSDSFSDLWRKYPDLLHEHIRRTERYRRMVSAGEDPLVAAIRLTDDPSFVDSLRSAVTTLQSGLVAINPKDGHVKAWIGGRDFTRDQFDKVSQAKRQPGSTFKPFVYAAAIESGLSPEFTMKDSAYAYPVSSTIWRPLNFGGGYSGEMITLRRALAESKNTVTAQLIDLVGTRSVRDAAMRMGFESELRSVPSLALGTSEVSLLEMASAYGSFATGGYHARPIVITRIEDRKGALVARFDAEPRKAISTRAADAVLDMLRGVTNPGGTGMRIRSAYQIPGDLAGKTGTTQNAADGWFVLMHPDLVSAAWVGFNDQRVTFRSSYWGQGAHNALNIVGDFARSSLEQGIAFGPHRFKASPLPRVQYAGESASPRQEPPIASAAYSSPTGTIRRLSW